MEFDKLSSILDFISDNHYFMKNNGVREFYDHDEIFTDDKIQKISINDFLFDLFYNRILEWDERDRYNLKYSIEDERKEDGLIELIKLMCNSKDLQEKFFKYGLKNLWKFIPIFEYAKTFYLLQQPYLSIFDIDIKLEKYRNTNLYFSNVMHKYPNYYSLCDFIKYFNSDNEDTLNLISSVIYYCVSGKRDETYIKYERLMRLGLTLKEALNGELPRTELSKDSYIMEDNNFSSVYILPNLLVNIASYLDYRSMLNLIKTCKFFFKSSCLRDLYKKSIQEYFSLAKKILPSVNFDLNISEYTNIFTVLNLNLSHECFKKLNTRLINNGTVKILIYKFPDINSLREKGEDEFEASELLLGIIEFLSNLDSSFPKEERKIENMINKIYYKYANHGHTYPMDSYKKSLLELLMIFSIDPDSDYRGFASKFLFSYDY